MCSDERSRESILVRICRCIKSSLGENPQNAEELVSGDREDFLSACSKVCTRRSVSMLVDGWDGAPVSCVIQRSLHQLWNSINTGPLASSLTESRCYLLKNFAWFPLQVTSELKTFWHNETFRVKLFVRKVDDFLYGHLVNIIGRIFLNRHICQLFIDGRSSIRQENLSPVLIRHGVGHKKSGESWPVIRQVLMSNQKRQMVGYELK